MAFRRKAFKDIGGLSANRLTEDLDAAYTLKEKGWEVEQSNFPIYSEVPNNLKSLYKQKLRWGGGLMQSFIAHRKVVSEQPPLEIILMLSYTLLIWLFVITFFASLYHIAFLITNNSLSVPALFSDLAAFIFYPLISFPFVLYDRADRRKISSYLLAILYSLIYFPIFSIVVAITYARVIIFYKNIEKGRAW